MNRRAPIVVGIGRDRPFDKGGGSACEHGCHSRCGRREAVVDALDWATAEAAAQGRPLRIVHAICPPLLIDVYGMSTGVWDCDHSNQVMEQCSPEQAWRCADRAVKAAVDRARSIAPEIEVRAEVVTGTPSAVLRRESRNAHLLVVGQPDRCQARWLRRLLVGSVSAQLAARTHCPVVVAPPDPLENAPRVRSTPRVVVDVDPNDPCDHSITLAFRAARQRDIGLTALHVTAGPGARHDRHRKLDDALSRWHARYPEVVLTTQVLTGDRTHILPAHSVGAALLVLNRRRRTQPPRTRTDRAILCHASCPVAVVHHSLPRPKW